MCVRAAALSSTTGTLKVRILPAGASFVAAHDVPEVLACMDVFVAPFISPSCETQGIAPLEAMAMSIPVVHFGVGGMQVCAAVRL